VVSSQEETGRKKGLIMQTSELTDVEKRPNGSVGMMSFHDGSFLPSILVDLRDNKKAESKFCTLYENERLRNFSVTVKPSEVSVFSGKELLDGGNLTWFSAIINPEDPDDINGFGGLLPVTGSWALSVQVSSGEILFVVDAQSGNVVLTRKTDQFCEFKKIFRE
jgi:hypothetical protein